MKFKTQQGWSIPYHYIGLNLQTKLEKKKKTKFAVSPLEEVSFLLSFFLEFRQWHQVTSSIRIHLGRITESVPRYTP